MQATTDNALFAKFYAFLRPRAKPIGVRIFRSLCYFIVALILLTINQYGLSEHQLGLALSIAVLGGGSTSAKLGIAAIAVLLGMALVTPDTLILISKASI